MIDARPFHKSCNLYKGILNIWRHTSRLVNYIREWPQANVSFLRVTWYEPTRIHFAIKFYVHMDVPPYSIHCQMVRCIQWYRWLCKTNTCLYPCRWGQGIESSIPCLMQIDPSWYDNDNCEHWKLLSRGHVHVNVMLSCHWHLLLALLPSPSWKGQEKALAE